MNLFGSSLEVELQNAENGAKNTKQASARKEQILAKRLGKKAQYRDPFSDGSIAIDNSGPVQL